jgi:hypothetical protein
MRRALLVCAAALLAVAAHTGWVSGSTASPRGESTAAASRAAAETLHIVPDRVDAIAKPFRHLAGGTELALGAAILLSAVLAFWCARREPQRRARPACALSDGPARAPPQA